MLMPRSDDIFSSFSDLSSKYWMLVDILSPLKVKNVTITRSLKESL